MDSKQFIGDLSRDRNVVACALEIISTAIRTFPKAGEKEGDVPKIIVALGALAGALSASEAQLSDDDRVLMERHAYKTLQPLNTVLRRMCPPDSPAPWMLSAAFARAQALRNADAAVSGGALSRFAFMSDTPHIDATLLWGDTKYLAKRRGLDPQKRTQAGFLALIYFMTGVERLEVSSLPDLGSKAMHAAAHGAVRFPFSPMPAGMLVCFPHVERAASQAATYILNHAQTHDCGMTHWPSVLTVAGAILGESLYKATRFEDTLSASSPPTIGDIVGTSGHPLGLFLKKIHDIMGCSLDHDPNYAALVRQSLSGYKPESGVLRLPPLCTLAHRVPQVESALIREDMEAIEDEFNITNPWEKASARALAGMTLYKASFSFFPARQGLSLIMINAMAGSLFPPASLDALSHLISDDGPHEPIETLKRRAGKVLPFGPS